MLFRTSRYAFAFTAACVFLFQCIFSQNSNKNKLWYDKPATVWNEALPIGNGRLGAMAFGDPINERLQLNESTFWSGGPSRNDNPDGPTVLDSIRYYIFHGNYKRAEILADNGLTAKKLHGSAFQSVGNLNLTFDGNRSYTDYYRELDIERALFTTTFKVGDVAYKREIFASMADNVIVVKLMASKPNKISFTAGLDSELLTSAQVIDGNTLEMTGLSSTHEGVLGQVKFDARAKIIRTGGKITVEDGKIKVANANEVTIFVSIATNFTDYRTLSTSEVAKCSEYLIKVEKKKYGDLLQRHTKSYQQYFKRVQLDLGDSRAAKLPTDKRLANFGTTYDPDLISLYYQFGRYLLICSSRPGGQPATLQGVWNESIHPAWDSKYTININTEMNYWPAEKTNLAEMHEPLIQMVKELSQTGAETARVMYKSRGWVAHHNTDVWRISGVVDFANAGQWPLGSAWLSQHLWERYLYNGDKKYLSSVYPILKSASEFYVDFLIEDPATKWLVVSPSISPENTPDGHQGSALAAGNTIDNQLVFDLFTKTIAASKVLNVDAKLAETLQKLIARLPPAQIGRYGQLQEWIRDWDNPDDKHRHVSHLYALFPGNQITPYTTPELTAASRTVLKHRGDESTGWSMGWKVNLWARLLDGNHAYKLIKEQLRLVDPITPSNKGGTYPNLFDAHPPFQIDGNFGCTSGITEMLLQTQSGAIDILPALPDDWKNGSISGLRTYGGFEVSIAWKDNSVAQINITSNLGGNCRIRVRNEVIGKDGLRLLPSASTPNPNPYFAMTEIAKPIISAQATIATTDPPLTYIYDFATEAGKSYTITIKN